MALRACKECGKEISTDAKVCPHCGKRVGMSTLSGCLLIVVAVILGLIILNKILDTGNESTNNQTPVLQPKDDADLLLSRCGKPDVDDSTAYDNPRPPIPTRFARISKGACQGFLRCGRHHWCTGNYIVESLTLNHFLSLPLRLSLRTAHGSPFCLPTHVGVPVTATATSGTVSSPSFVCINPIVKAKPTKNAPAG